MVVFIYILLATLVHLSSTSPLSLPLEPRSDDREDRYLLPIRIGSPKQTVYLKPIAENSEITVIESSFCQPMAMDQKQKESCVANHGGTFDPEASENFEFGSNIISKIGDTKLPLNWTSGTDTIELGDTTLVETNFTLTGLLSPTAMSKYKSQSLLHHWKGSFGFSNESCIWNELRESDAKINTRSCSFFPGVLTRSSPSSQVFERQHPGSLIFGGYNRQLISGPVLSTVMHGKKKPRSFKSPKLIVTSIVYKSTSETGKKETVVYTAPRSSGNPFVIDLSFDQKSIGSPSVLNMPLNIHAQLLGLTGAKPTTTILNGRQSNKDAAREIYTLPPSLLSSMGDLVVTIQAMESKEVEDRNRKEFQPTPPGLNSTNDKLTITIPSFNLLQMPRRPSNQTIQNRAPDSDSIRLAIGKQNDSNSEYCWGTPLLRSIYTIHDFQRGVFHLAQANLDPELGPPQIESLDRPFQETWYGGSIKDPDTGPRTNYPKFIGFGIGGAALLGVLFFSVWRFRNRPQKQKPMIMVKIPWDPLAGRGHCGELDSGSSELCEIGTSQRGFTYELPVEQRQLNMGARMAREPPGRVRTTRSWSF